MIRITSRLPYLMLSILLVSFFLLAGCGLDGQPESDGWPDMGVRVDGSVAVNDAGGPTAGQVDTVYNADCDGDPTTLDPEDFYDAMGDVTFTSTTLSTSDDPATLYITDYTVEFIPELTQDPDATVVSLVMPPALGPLSFETSIVLPPDETVAIESGIFLVPISIKNIYYNLVTAAYTNYLFGNYSIRVTFHGKSEFGDSFKIVVYTNAVLGGYDNC